MSQAGSLQAVSNRHLSPSLVMVYEYLTMCAYLQTQDAD